MGLIKKTFVALHLMLISWRLASPATMLESLFPSFEQIVFDRSRLERNNNSRNMPLPFMTAGTSSTVRTSKSVDKMNHRVDLFFQFYGGGGCDAGAVVYTIGRRAEECIVTGGTSTRAHVLDGKNNYKYLKHIQS